jgi:hypothetical protein
MTKDYLGQEINVGDPVIFVQLNYRNFLKGTITKITEKTVLISHPKTNTCSTETKQYPDQVINIKHILTFF